MASKATPATPAPASKGKAPMPPRTLDEEMKDVESSDSDDDAAELAKKLKKTHRDMARMQDAFNNNAAEVTRLQQMIQQNPERAQLMALQQEVNTLRAAANIITTPHHDGREKLRLNSPQAFDGTPGQLKGFLTQVRAYQRFHGMSFKDEAEKVIHAASFLKGRALAWFEPHLTDFMTNEWDGLKSETQLIFQGYHGFEKALLSLFQEPDEQRQYERDLANLRQKGAATHYAAEFRRICARLDYTDATKIFLFYEGLKEDVKDELSKQDRPDDFLQYAELAVKIDNRLFERRKEKNEKRAPANSGRKYQWQPQRQFQQNHPQRNGQTERPRGNNWQNNQNRNSTAYGHHSGPMDLSIAQRDNKARDFKCYNCDKPGHMARECRQPKKQRFQPVPEKSRQINIASKDIPHASLSWTACYDDNCLIHQDGKEQSGWYPKPPRTLAMARSGYEKTGICKTPNEHQRQCVDVLRQVCGIASYQKIPDARKGLMKDDPAKKKETPQEQPRTLAMMRRGPNQKLTRKINEQLDEMLQEGKLEEVRRPMLQGLVAPNGQIDITALDQVAAANPRDPRTWTSKQREAYERAASDHPQGPDSLNYDSEETPSYRIMPSQYYETYIASSSDEESPEPPKRPEYQIIHPADDNQSVKFHGTAYKKNHPPTPLVPGDHPLLDPSNQNHQDLFWAECLDDNCKDHKKGKKKFYFYPRRYTEEPIQDVYLHRQLPFWTMRLYEEGNIATFAPDPEYPIKSLEKGTGKETAKKLKKPTKEGQRTATTYKTLCATYDAAHFELDIEIQGRRTRAVIDSGAQGDFISPRLVNEREIPWQKKERPYALRTVEGEQVEYGGGLIVLETVHLPLQVHGQKEELQFDITEIGDADVILGITWLRKHNPRIDWRTGQLQWSDSVTEQHCKSQASNESSRAPLDDTTQRTRYIAYLREIRPSKTVAPAASDQGSDPLLAIPEEYRKYDKLFAPELETGLPEHGPYDHEIPLIEGSHPKFHPIYGLNETEREALDKYLDENLKKGYIRPSESSAGYPILFVPKKNGKLRLCVDYRQLNSITKKNCYPLPLISELRDLLHGANWFTALDLKGAYNLIRMKEGEEWKTAFRTRKGLFEYLVMPFGLTNAPATFQTMINHVLSEFIDIFVVVYLDDILIFSPTLELHKEHVHKVLQKLQDAKLLVEAEKCEFHSKKVDFLGYTITPGQIEMEAKKVQAVRDWPTPQNVKDVQSFLGFVNFYRRFLKGYAGNVKCIQDLTRKDTPFEWTKERNNAFEKVKQQVSSEPVTRIPDPDKPFEVETDASDFAMGGQLGQRDEGGRLYPCAFFSKAFHGPELNYQIHDKELMAIIEAFHEWRPQLSGTKHEVLVYTDHKNLAHFTTSKNLNKRQVRWSEFLSEYNFRIIYRKGTDNGRADALSRRMDHEVPVPEETQVILKKDKNGDLVPAQKLLMIARRVMIGTTNKMTHEMIREIHGARTHGHQGVTKTWKRIRQHHDQRVTRQDVADAIRDCEPCKKSKNSPHKPYGQIQPLPVPPAAWHSISLDFIVKLPKSREPLTKVYYDSVLVIVDRLTKYAYFIPYLEASTAEDLAYTFLKYIISNHGLPKEIVSDRDKLFTSKFWKSLISQLGADHKLSTSFHPQTDGQTERINQILEQYLRCYVNYDQDNWVALLPTAQFAYNSAVGESTLHSPFYLNYGFEPTAHGEPREGPRALKAVADINKMREIQTNVSQDLELVRERMKKYANTSRIGGPSFEEGDSAYLIRRNIKTKRPSDKLDYKKLGPFEILKKVSPVNYKLKLPDTMKIHPVFHIALLEPAPRGSHTEDCIIVEPNEPEYEVERIIDHRNEDGHDEYLIKWKGYGHEDNSWEPIKNLQHSQALLTDYHLQEGQVDHAHRADGTSFSDSRRLSSHTPRNSSCNLAGTDKLVLRKLPTLHKHHPLLLTHTLQPRERLIHLILRLLQRLHSFHKQRLSRLLLAV
ncbi:reverse transcriptase domain protein [Colletotrichum tabaci]|uniref:RNA-directed DNA polymerase n=1 Tax=Colletotrichum tabaci TaxID=1209068 RepID=A0AAV9TGN6_9PEZI